MAEENKTTKELLESADTAAALDVLQGTLDRFMEPASVEAVYGKPIKNGDMLIIPTAEVASFMGFGFGSGSGESTEGQEDTPMSGSGTGGGGGGSVHSRPVAMVIASPQGVRVEPVIDLTKIGLAALTSAGFIIATLARMKKGPKG